MSKAVSAFDPLPAGLDPSTINNEVLRKHGLPPRPHPDLQPQLLEQWNRIMAQPTRFIRAELAIDDVIAARSGRPEGLGGMAPVGPTAAGGHRLRRGWPASPGKRRRRRTTRIRRPSSLPNGWCQRSRRSARRALTGAS